MFLLKAKDSINEVNGTMFQRLRDMTYIFNQGLLILIPFVPRCSKNYRKVISRFGISLIQVNIFSLLAIDDVLGLTSAVCGTGGDQSLIFSFLVVFHSLSVRLSELSLK